MRRILAGLSALATLSLAGAASAAGPIFPAAEWAEATPESQAVDSRRLEEAMADLAANIGSGGVSEAMVIRNGRVIWEGPNVDAYHHVWSSTKSFTSTVLGLLIDDGKCTLDDRAADYWPTLDDRYPAYARIRLRHLASMSSGYDGDRGRITKESPWGEPAEFLTPAEPLFEPGTRYKYHDAAIHLLGAILTRIAKEPLKDLFKRRIADPIGMSHWDWVHIGRVDGIQFNSPSGIYGLGIQTTARDLARFGHLFLNRGQWNGKQLISEAWADQATTNQVSPALPPSLGTGRYGFLWWTNGPGRDAKLRWPSAPPKTFAALGRGSNWCFVVPEWRMVVVRMATGVGPPTNSNQVWDSFFQRLRQALEVGGQTTR